MERRWIEPYVAEHLDPGEIAGGTGSGNGGSAHGWTDEEAERLRASGYLVD